MEESILPPMIVSKIVKFLAMEVEVIEIRTEKL